MKLVILTKLSVSQASSDALRSNELLSGAVSAFSDEEYKLDAPFPNEVHNSDAVCDADLGTVFLVCFGAFCE